MEPKFKIGDIIVSHSPDVIREIIDISGGYYTFKCIENGGIHPFPVDYTDEHWWLEPLYLLKKVFNEDLQKVINE